MNRREAIKASAVGAAAIATGVAFEQSSDDFLAGPVEFIGGYNVHLTEPELVEASWIDTNGKGHFIRIGPELVRVETWRPGYVVVVRGEDA